MITNILSTLVLLALGLIGWKIYSRSTRRGRLRSAKLEQDQASKAGVAATKAVETAWERKKKADLSVKEATDALNKAHDRTVSAADSSGRKRRGGWNWHRGGVAIQALYGFRF